ncbi:MAG: chloride channel protein [Dehalococcoidia bacterium]
MQRSTLRDPENLRIAVFTLLGTALGLIGAAVAFLLYRLILLFTNIAFFQRFSFDIVYPSSSHVGNWVLIIPAIGGLIVGIMAKYGSDRIRGHGIPEAMEAVLTNRSRVSPKIAILKPISAAIAVGTGGPFGAEGPIIQTGGGIGSVIGQTFHLTAGERKILLGCGAAAGMVGIFYTPITAVVIVLELLMFEFRPRSLLPVIMAAAVAAGARHYLIGGNLMFPMNESYGDPSVLPLFALLGIVIGIIAAGFSKALYWTEEAFEKLGRLGVDILWWPAIGGLILGVIARFEPRVLGMGYNTIDNIILGKLGTTDLIRLSIGKSVALWAALGSGTSGGLLAPMLLIGAATGSIFGSIVHAILPGASFNAHVAAIVAMSALFGAAARAPFTAFVFAFELTGDNSAIVPLMIGGVTADVACRFLLKQSIMTERLARRGLNVPTDYVADPLHRITVGSAMTRVMNTIPASMTVHELIGRLDRREPGYRHQGFPVVDEHGRLLGIVTRSDVAEATSVPGQTDVEVPENANVGAITSTDVEVTFVDTPLSEALTQMVRRRVGRLPVVDRADPRQLVGWLTRGDIFRARESADEEENLRERPIRLRRRRAGVSSTAGAGAPKAVRAASDGVTGLDADTDLAVPTNGGHVADGRSDHDSIAAGRNGRGHP